MVTLYRAWFPGHLEVIFGPFAQDGNWAPIGWASLAPDNTPVLAFYGRHRRGQGSAGSAYQVLREQQDYVPIQAASVPAEVKLLYNAFLKDMRQQLQDLNIPKANDSSLQWAKASAADSIDEQAFEAMLKGGEVLRQRERLLLNRITHWTLVLTLVVLAILYITGSL